MGYKLSLLLNTILSLIFIGLVAYHLIEDPELSTPAISAMCYILLIYPSFLWLNYICFKTKQALQNHAIVLPHVKTGKILSVIIIIFAITVIIFTLLTLIPLFTNQSKAAGAQVIGFAIFIIFSILSAVAAIINVMWYRKSVKQNKLIVNSVINTIGENTTQ